jgi:hypothetical protein
MHRDESDGRCSEIFKIRPRERWRWRETMKCSLLQKMEDVALPIFKKRGQLGLK